MANKLTITQELYDQALAQVLSHLLKGRTHLTADHLRPDAKKLLDTSLWMAYEFHRDHPPMQLPPSPLLNNPHVPESTRTMLRENAERTKTQMAENHRAGLIKLVKLNDEMTVDVATKLVDEIIAL